MNNDKEYKGLKDEDESENYRVPVDQNDTKEIDCSFAVEASNALEEARHVVNSLRTPSINAMITLARSIAYKYIDDIDRIYLYQTGYVSVKVLNHKSEHAKREFIRKIEITPEFRVLQRITQLVYSTYGAIKSQCIQVDRYLN